VPLDFSERFARRLKLTVIDDRNAPLPISTVTAMSAARQVVFPLSPLTPLPSVCTTAAPEPWSRITTWPPGFLGPEFRPLARLTLGPQRDNPVYQPEPKPFSERAPWLVYVFLAAASLALAAIRWPWPGPRRIRSAPTL